VASRAVLFKRIFPIHNMIIFYLLLATNLLKHHGVVGCIAMNLTNHRDALVSNIHQCTFVTKKRICRRIMMNLTNRRNVLGFNAHS
jgi:hypothetical protein